MTTEKHDPWALLREAQRLIAANRLMLGHYSGVREVGSLEDGIDAALAERQDSATDVVEWLPNGKAFDARVNGYLVEVKPSTDGWWGWKAEQIPVHRDRQHGHKRTKELAQEAAIVAARGLK